MRRTTWLVTLAGMTLVGGEVSSAQVTFTVFPAATSIAPTPARQPTGTNAAPVSLALRDSTIAYTVRALTRQAHLHLVYDGTDPRFLKRVTVNVVETNVMDALAIALRGTDLKATMASDDETVLIAPRMASGSLPATRGRSFAAGMVTGRVTDSASGQGLGGASVRVEGLKNFSAVTSDSGHFTFKDVPPGDQLIAVKLFGYRPAERTVTVVDSSLTTVRITMVPVPTVLSGMVTTASGTQRKIEVGNDITTLNVDSIMEIAPITSITDLLETRVPGLTVLHSSGVPGDPSRLRLRGVSSIDLNNDPILIVDGIRIYASQSDSRNQNLAPSLIGSSNVGGSSVSGQAFAAPSPLDQIDPNSIATIEIFKGPSASALYGSDAANGVIVITTKHGRAGPTHWDLAVGQGVNWLPGNWPVNYFIFGSAPNYVPLSFGSLCRWNTPNCTVDSVVAFQALNDPRYTVFSHGSDQTASLTVSGGTPTLTYSLSGSAAGDVGNLKLPAVVQQQYDSAYGQIPSDLVRPDNYKTWGVSSSLTAQPTPQARVTLQSSLFNSTQQRSSLESSIVQLEGEYVQDGSALNVAGVPSGQSLIQNEVELATAGSLSSTNALTVFWQFTPWLPLTATAGLNTIQRTDETFIPYGIDAGGPGATPVQDTTGYYGLGRGTSRDQTLNVGTAIPLFRQHMTLALGGNVFDESTADISVSTHQLAPGVSVPTSFLNLNGTNSLTDQSTSGASTYGWYVEPRLNFASKFFAAPGFRLDGGSGGTRLNTQSGNVGGLSAFPKIDLSYVAVDRQNARPLFGILTMIRPRVAFGIAGTQPGPEEKLRLFNGASSVDVVQLNDTTTVPSVALSSLGNTTLRPERSSEMEGGFDATLWRGRLTLSYTQYDKTRYDALLDIPVAPSVAGNQLFNYALHVGVGLDPSETVNIGVIRNTGKELSINATLIQGKAVSWNVGVNQSNGNNVVVSLNPGQSPIVEGGGGNASAYTERVVPGYPLFGLWARPIVSFADANHSGFLEPADIRYGDSAVYVGQPNPKSQFNLTTNLVLFNGRLSINATFAYQNGLTQINEGACESGAFALLPNTPNTPLATQAAVVAAGCGGSFGVTDYGLIQTVSTLRFNDLSLNYNVPRTVSSWFHVPRMTLALQGRNLGLLSNYRGIDPDVNAFSTVSAGDETEDLGQIPEPRTWWLKVSFSN